MKLHALRGVSVRLALRLAMSALIMSLATPLTSSIWAQGAGPQSTDLTELRQYSLELVNQSRAEEGLPSLELEPTLNRSADDHAMDMLERDYFAHVSPGGEDVMDRYLEAGGSRWRLIQENIGKCSNCPVPPDRDAIRRQHDNWMNSPEHRAAILGEGLSHFGLGIAAGEAEAYFVQNFSGPGDPRGLGEGQRAEPLSPSAIAALAAELVNDQRSEGSGLSVSEPLVEAAYALIPEDLTGFSLEEIGNPAEAVANGGDAAWRRLAVVAGSCGGCGVEPTDADVRYFVNGWLQNQQYRDRLLNPEFGLLGFAIRADGEGRKIAIALLGAQ